MNPLSSRLHGTIPADFQVQKCKCREQLPEGELAVDLVVQSARSLPIHNIALLKLKGSISVDDLLATPLRVRGLILHKALNIPEDKLNALKAAWNVEQIFNFKDKTQKQVVRARLREFQGTIPGDLNKIVINPESSSDKKAKVVLSGSFLDRMLDMQAAHEAPMDNVATWKFAVDFQEKHTAAFPQFLELCRANKEDVGIKKCVLSPEQTALVAAAKAAVTT